MSELVRAGQDWGARLRTLTPARVGLGRTGVSVETRDLLDFQRAHAQARDAVHARLEVGAVAAALSEIWGGEALRLHSAAADRATYLQRPDLGRILDEASRSLLAGAKPADGFELVVVVADGLSALAVERHAAPLMSKLVPRLVGWRRGPVCVVEQGRVAIGDEIGLALGAEIVVVLIGERPGLSSPDSLGVYITWAPRPVRTDAERNCISNIRAEGLSYSEASAQLADTLTAARRLELTGVGLKMETRLMEKGSKLDSIPGALAVTGGGCACGAVCGRLFRRLGNIQTAWSATIEGDRESLRSDSTEREQDGVRLPGHTGSTLFGLAVFAGRGEPVLATAPQPESGTHDLRGFA